MQIAAINTNNYKSNFKGYENTPAKTFPNDDFDTADLKDVRELSTTKKGYTSPIKFFAATAALAIASYVAVKKASLLSIKGMDGKFPLFNTLDSLGKSLNKKYTQWQKKFTKVEVNNFKTYMQNTANRLLKWGENVAKQGVTDAEKAAYKGHVRDLYAKNAIRKMAASTLGAGAAALTMAKRYKDSDKNGIPDALDKKPATTLDKIQDAVEAIPTIAAAVNLA